MTRTSLSESMGEVWGERRGSAQNVRWHYCSRLGYYCVSDTEILSI